jgi:acyl dehydratase
LPWGIRVIDPAAILAHPVLEVRYRYDARDVMLYALATGLGTDPMDTDQLRFAYEELKPPLLVLPTFAIVLGWVDLVRDPRSRNPRLGLDGARVVVGQAGLKLYKPMAQSGSGCSRSYFAEVVDKGPGRGALVCARREVYDDGGDLVAVVDTWLFARGGGGFGGASIGGLPRQPLPARPPDAIVQTETPAHLALLYRLSLGDHNPVHADPAHALATGFDRPILHGLASLSIGLHGAIRGITGSLASHGSRLRAAYATQARPVFPGDCLRTQAWAEGTDIRFQTTVVARSEVVVDAGWLRLDPPG